MIEEALEILLWATLERETQLTREELSNAIIGLITLVKLDEERKVVLF
jgi:hypothetical protein